MFFKNFQDFLGVLVEFVASNPPDVPSHRGFRQNRTIHSQKGRRGFSFFLFFACMIFSFIFWLYSSFFFRFLFLLRFFWRPSWNNFSHITTKGPKKDVVNQKQHPKQSHLVGAFLSLFKNIFRQPAVYFSLSEKGLGIKKENDLAPISHRVIHLAPGYISAHLRAPRRQDKPATLRAA